MTQAGDAAGAITDDELRRLNAALRSLLASVEDLQRRLGEQKAPAALAQVR
jgi:hypothetical protein